MANWFTNPASNTMLDNSFRNQFFQNQVKPVQTGATNVRPTNMAALRNWTPWKAFMPQSMGGTFHTGGTGAASSALGYGAAVGLPALYTGAAMGLQKSLPDELKGEGGIYDTAGYDDPMSAGASIPPETDEILRANAIFSGNRPVEETVTDQWTLPQTDWGEVKPTEPQPERGKIDMFLQKFGVPPMTQVSDADRTANKQFMQEQGIGRDPQTGRMYGGNWNEASQDFAGKNAPGTSAWGSANFGEMAQKWDEEYGDMNYATQKMKDKQTRIKQQAAEFAVQQQVEQQERIRNERAAASAANQMTQRRPGMGGSHMSRDPSQGGLGLTTGQAQAVSDANAAAGMGGWGLAHGGRVGLQDGGWSPGVGRSTSGYQSNHPGFSGVGGEGGNLNVIQHPVESGAVLKGLKTAQKGANIYNTAKSIKDLNPFGFVLGKILKKATQRSALGTEEDEEIYHEGGRVGYNTGGRVGILAAF